MSHSPSPGAPAGSLSVGSVDLDSELAARDAGRIVGTLRSWDLALSVPGGAVTANAISGVTVLPTHTRRGALTSMIGADLAAAADRGVPVAVLIASEAGIYGRYGFGPAADAATWHVDVRAAQLHPQADELADEQDVEVADDVTFREVGPAVFARSRRPGDIDRSEHWWDIAAGLMEGPHGAGGPNDSQVTLISRDAAGHPQGVLRYKAHEEWQDRVCRTRVDVTLLDAASVPAYLALWRYLLRLDLVATVRAEDRPVDEAVPWMLTDARAARQTSRCDLLWSRVLDPAALLAARRYPLPGTVVLEVHDALGWAGGRFALEVTADGRADCRPTTSPPDVELPVQTLGTVWLGGGDLMAAATAGRARQVRDGGLARVAALLRTPQAPACSTWF